MEPIRIAIVGVGNCASALVQGVEWYRQHITHHNGLIHAEIDGCGPGDIEVVAAFDIDARKVNRPLSEAVFAAPNCLQPIVSEVSNGEVIVQMGELLDGVSDHLAEYPEDRRFVVAKQSACDVERVLADSGAEILLNYLPVGSQMATEFYAQCCLNTGVSLINCMPVFIVSDSIWAGRFIRKNIPCVGDDIKSQLGATILHRMLAKLFRDRGIAIDCTYQLNTGGNTDFLNMLNRRRLSSKRISKTEAVQSQLETPLPDDRIHIGPSDYVPFQKDNKVCFLRMEGRGFADVPLEIELRLSVQDSPNSAGVAIDAVRCCKLARDCGLGGPLIPISAYLMKHPPVQMSDQDALRQCNQFIAKAVAR